MFHPGRLGTSLATVAFLLLHGSADARETALEAAIKANYLYKFTPFVTWPPTAFASATSPFNLCILGIDPFGEALDAAARNQQVSGHPVVVRRLAKPEGLLACHLIYTGAGRGQGPADILQPVARRPVLTVTEDAPGAPPGIIRFVLLQGRVRFMVDAPAAQSAGLTISSKLLALAVVRPDDRS